MFRPASFEVADAILGATSSRISGTRCPIRRPQIRDHELRPICQACLTATDRPNAVIEHPAGEETQWDWLDLLDPPASWARGSMAHLFVVTLGVLEQVVRDAPLGDDSTPDRRLARPDLPERGWGEPDLAFRSDGHAAGNREHRWGGQTRYGVSVAICPPRRGNRKGVVAKSNHTAAQRWWRTLPDGEAVEAAQDSLSTVGAPCLHC